MSKALLTTAFLLGMAAASEASLVTFNFTATTYGYSESDYNNWYPNVPNGIAVTGQFSFDTDAVPLINNPGVESQFTLTNLSILVSGYQSMSGSNGSIYSSSGSASLSATYSSYPYTVSGSLWSNNASLFSSAASIYDAFRDGSLTFDTGYVYKSESQVFGGYYYSGGYYIPWWYTASSNIYFNNIQLTDVTPTPVPEPTTALFGAALLGVLGVLGCARHRERPV